MALAEWLAITHADDSIAVHCMCPQAARTQMPKTPKTPLPLQGSPWGPAMLLALTSMTASPTATGGSPR
ncbi:hypothetical protein EGT67_09640 [Prescottella agglutinans]|uniref:Uncharacterized protein n=1 Tax=Prescottella agglutinans TaxID=1644129 RepID=A0A438BFA1_9NOCA|nr:hypothetical protein EGT67_09640 [Prescottella agglutinans]